MRAGNAQDGGHLPIGDAIRLHPALEDRATGRRAWELGGQLLFAAVLIVGGTFAVAVALMLVLVTAPVAAAIVLWLVWRSGDRVARRTRARRTRERRTRARALGLTVVG